MTAVPGCARSLVRARNLLMLLANDRTGAVKQRANVLHHLLEETKELQGRDLNFLAHSMVRLSPFSLPSLLISFAPTGWTRRTLPHLQHSPDDLPPSLPHHPFDSSPRQ